MADKTNFASQIAGGLVLVVTFILILVYFYQILFLKMS